VSGVRISAVAAAIALVLAACGSSGLTDAQLRTRATRICELTTERTGRIATPAEPSQEAAFVSHGIAALAPKVAALRRLRAPSDMSGDFRAAVQATSAELTALRSTLRGLRAGNDPVVAIKTLQEQLKPAEAQAGAAWTTLQLPACQDD
jgi:hypothetical protein